MTWKCWTCNSEHDLDEACRASMTAHSARAAGGDPFMTPSEARFGPVFIASHDGNDVCCGDGIWNGERIRADGEGGFVHEECAQ